eukprot:Gb_20015 [translate_table: standard]
MKMEMTGSKQERSEKEFGEYDLPGFRFHPTEQELVGFYLQKMVQGRLNDFRTIGVLDLYRYDPCDLPSLARIGEREWFFFVPRDKKVQNGGRPNRITVSGYWKAMGSDNKGRAPRGQKTDWVMNEYRMPEPSSLQQKPKKDMVVCRVYRKAVSQKSLEERAMNEADELNSTDEDLTRYKLTEEKIVSSRELVTDKKAVKDRPIVLPDQNCISAPKTAQYEAKQFCKSESCCTTPVASDISHSTEKISDGVGYTFEGNGTQSEAMSNSLVCQERLDTTFRPLTENPKNTKGFSSVCKSKDIVSVLSLKDSSSGICLDRAFQIFLYEKSELQMAKYCMDFCNDSAHIRLTMLENNPWAELWD